MLTQLFQDPNDFFRRLKDAPVQWATPLLLLFMLFVLTSAVPLAVGALQQQDLLASLIWSGVSLTMLLLFALLCSRGARVLEVFGYGLMPLLLAMVLMFGLWFWGDLARTVGSIATFSGLLLSVRRIFIGLQVMTNRVIAWQTMLIAPLLTFLFMAVPFGLLVRWLGLA